MAEWFRGGEKVYALDGTPVRPNDGSGSTAGIFDGTHWKKPAWSGRAFFSLLSEPPSLRLNQLERTDTGSYVCNVTYRNVTSAEVTFLVQLFVAGELYFAS